MFFSGQTLQVGHHLARMVHYCKVFDCNNNSTDERLSFHKFPDDPKLRKVGITSNRDCAVSLKKYDCVHI